MRGSLLIVHRLRFLHRKYQKKTGSGNFLYNGYLLLRFMYGGTELIPERAIKLRDNSSLQDNFLELWDGSHDRLDS